MPGWCRGLIRSERQASKKVYSFLEAEGLTHSLFDAIFDRMLSTRRVSLSYRRRHCERCITSRGCSGGKGSNDNRFTKLGWDAGKELTRARPVVCMLLGASSPMCTTENLPSMRVCSGDIPLDNHCTNMLSTKW